MRYFIVFLFLVAGCVSSKKEIPENPYFEGMVEFDIDIRASDPYLDSVYNWYFGSYYIVYIKDSLISRVYCNKHDVIIKREIIRSDSMKLYAYREGSDTMYVEDLSHNYAFKTIGVKEAGYKSILGRNCMVVEMEGEVRERFYLDPYRQTTKYYFDTATILNPRIHGNIKYGDYYKIFSKYHFLTLGYYTELANGVVVSSFARRIMKGKVDDLYFDVPKNKVEINPYTSL